MTVTTLPTFPTLASGAIFIKGFANNGASTATVAQYVTFGHCFQKGQLASGGGLEANIGGTVYPCQLDVKTSYSDGSPCHAVISMQIPGVAASTTVWGQFSPASAPGGAALSLATAIGSTTLTIELTAPASYPDWAASIAYQPNSLIKPTTGNAGGYIFQYSGDVNSTVGTSGATEPTWPQTEGASVADGTMNYQLSTRGIVGWLNVGLPFTGTITQDLIAAAKNSADLWLSGPLAVQGRAYVLPSNPGSLANATVNAALPAMMRIAVDLTAYKDGTVVADVVVANDCVAALQTTGSQICGGTQAYTAKLTLNGSIVFTSASLVHNTAADWSWQAGTVPHLVNSSQDLVLQVIHNPADFIEAQAVIPYDTTIGVGVDNLAANSPLFATEAQNVIDAAGFAQPLTNPDTAANPNMPAVGVSSANTGIGPNCFWQAWWLTTQNASFCGAGLEVLKVNGYVPWHVWNPNTGRYWSGADNEKVYVDNFMANSSQNGAFVPVATADCYWSINAQHFPDLVYIAYLFTGRRYALDQLIATTLYMQQLNVAIYFGYEGVVWSQTLILTTGNSPRERAWVMRHCVYALYACPDGRPEKTWMRTVVDNNFFWVLGNLQYQTSLQGECYGWMLQGTGSFNISPWMQDYALYIFWLAATMGHPLAKQLGWWMMHFRAGVLLNGANWPPSGFPTAEAIVYDYMMWNPALETSWFSVTTPIAVSWEGLEQLMRLSVLSSTQYGVFGNIVDVIFTGTVESNGALTVSSVQKGALEVGMTLVPNSDTLGGHDTATITGGSGTSWTTSYTGSAYTGQMSASNYNLPGSYSYWFTGTGGGGGNTDDYDCLLYNTLIQGQIVGHPDALTARNTMLALTDSVGTVVPNVTSDQDWQNSLALRLAVRTWNDSQIFPAAGAAAGDQGQSFAMVGPVLTAVPAAPPSVWPTRGGRSRVYFGNRR